MSVIATALANVFNPMCLFLIWFGTIIGIIFGSIPGLSATMAVVLFLPLTFSMEATQGLALLVGLDMGGISGGLISAILLDKEPGATIVTDSVTSSGLAQFITEWGGVHYRYKRGYRNVIDEAVRLNAAGIDCPLAIETSGHAALRENHFLDDGMYLVTVLIVEAMRLKQEGKELSSLLDGLREPVESVELRLNITAPDFREAGRTVIERVMDHASYETDWHIAPDNREGVRINFDLDDGLQNGWFLLRLSVHDPVLPLNVESDVPGGVRTMLSKLLSVLDGIEDIDISPIRAYLSKN